MLTARRLDRLEALAAELRAAHHVDVECIVCDLADRAAPKFLLEETKRRGLVVDTLVNNAGYGVTGTLVERDWQTHADFIEVMITAPAALCHRFVPGMRERGHGRIVNVASFAGLMPAPAGHTLYAASKSFLIRFSEALALENCDRDIRVCALCPGFTHSEFHDVTGSRASVSKMPKWVWLDADDVARDGLDAVERRDIVRIVGVRYRLLKALMKLVPDWLALKLIAANSANFRVTGQSAKR